MGPEFDGDAPQHKAPDHQPHGEVEAGESRCQNLGKGQEQRAPASQQPHFVAIPEGTDGRQHLASLFIGFRDN
jgi:hypothetical protein